VNVRTGPGLEYQAFQQVGLDRLVLVEAVEGEWCRFHLSDAVGYVTLVVLASVVSDEQQ